MWIYDYAFCREFGKMSRFCSLKHLLLKGLLQSIAYLNRKVPRLVHKQDIYVLLLFMIVDEPGCQQVS